MPKQSKRRRLTNQIRRGPKRHHSSNTRAMHLSHAEIGFRHVLFQIMAFHANGALRCLGALPTLILLSLLIRNGYISQGDDAISTVAVNFLLNLEQVKLNYYTDNFIACIQMDHDLHDIPFEEEAQPRAQMPRQHIRLSQWNNQTCYNRTSFLKYQLKKIYAQFGLEELAAENDGKISVYKGEDPITGEPFYYNFHPEELFLFFMTKCKHGYTNKEMCDEIFGGDQSRWSYGWPWILFYLDGRYQSIICHGGLIRYVNDFPLYYEAIQRKVMEDSLHIRNDDSGEIRTGLRFLPFDIAFFLDCSIFEVLVPDSGPDGDYIGAPRKITAYFSNRALYTRFKKLHGIKIETIMLPNGIVFLYGPASARPNDIGEAVLQMSGLDNFLYELQKEKQHIYSAFGDSIYGMAGLRCIRSYFHALGGRHLTEYEEICNKRLAACREAIEWGYAEISNVFSICANRRNFKLGKKNPYAQQQLRVCFLMQNIYVCLNGNHSSGYRMFNCSPPSLETYLSLE